MSDIIPAVTVAKDCWLYSERDGLCVVQEKRDARGKLVAAISHVIPWRLVEKALQDRPKK
jgi:hypothetical protein